MSQIVPADKLRAAEALGYTVERASLAYARRVRVRARWIGAWMRRAEVVVR